MAVLEMINTLKRVFFYIADWLTRFAKLMVYGLAISVLWHWTGSWWRTIGAFVLILAVIEQSNALFQWAAAKMKK